MEKASLKREQGQTMSMPPDNNNRPQSTGRLLLYNGSYQTVFTDSENNKEYILAKDGKKIYIRDIAILSLNNERKAREEKLMSDFDKQKSQYEKWKEHWFSKFNLANKTYDLCSTLKKQANKGYQNILSKTGCTSLADLKEYDKVNGGSNYKQAQMFLTQRNDARMGQIRAESDSIFYGRMYVDESNNVTNVEAQKILAQNLLA